MQDLMGLVRNERLDLGFTQFQMDEYIGVSKGTTQKIETNKIANCNIIKKYLDKLDYSIRYVKRGK